MSNIKGITVEIGGNTTELNKALGQPIKESISLQKELKEVDKLLKFDPGNVDLIAQKQQILAKNVEVSAQKVDILRQASQKMQQQLDGGMDVPIEQQRKLQRDLIQAEQILGANTKAAGNFANSLDKTGGAAEQTGSKIGGLSGILGKIEGMFGFKLPSGITNAVKGFDDARASGEGLGGSVTDLAKNMGIELPGGLDKAVGGLGKFTAGAMAAAAVAGVIIKTLIDMSIAGANAADELATNATIMGITNERYQEFAYMAELVDTSVDTIGNSMSRLTRSMSDAANGTEKAQAAFKKLGISYRNDLTGELRNNEDVFYDAIDALGKMTNETERDAVAMELMGRSARELNPLIAAGADEMRRLSQEAHEVGAVMSQEVVDAYLELSDEMERSKTIAEGLKNTLGGTMAPALTQALETVNNLIARISSSMQGSQVIQFLTDIYNMIGTIITIVGDVLGPALAGVFAYLEKLYGVVNLILAPLDFMLTSVRVLIGLLTGNMGWDEAVSEANRAGEKLMSSWGKSIDSIVGKNKDLQDSAKETGDAIGVSISDGYAAGTEAAEKEYMTLKEVNEKIKQSRDDAKKAAVSYYTTVVDSSGKLASVHRRDYELYEKNKEYIDAYYSDLSELQKVHLAKRLDQQKGANTALDKEVNSGLTKAGTEGQKAGQAVGVNITDGISRGMESGIPKVTKSTKAVVDAIKKEMTSGLDIHSPSREGFKWGAFTLGGFVQGFESMQSKLKASISDTLSIVKNGMGGAALASPAGGGTVINNNFTLQADRFKDVNQLLDSAERARQAQRASGGR